MRQLEEHTRGYKSGGVHVCTLFPYPWFCPTEFSWKGFNEATLSMLQALNRMCRSRGSVINQVVIDPYQAQTVRPISYPSGPFANDLGE